MTTPGCRLIDAGRALGVFAPAGQPSGPGGQRPQRISAALGNGAWVVVAHLVGHLGEPPIQHGRVGGKQRPPQGRGARALIGRVDHHLAPARAHPGTPQRRRVIAVHDRVDGLCGLAFRQLGRTASDRGS
jgi:hypothetical protein